MFPGPLNFMARREQLRELRKAAARAHRFDGVHAPMSQVTLRYAGAEDAECLRRLAALDSSLPPSGAVLLAEVDGHLRVALPLDGAPPLADPFHPGLELIELLRMRAAQLART